MQECTFLCYLICVCICVCEWSPITKKIKHLEVLVGVIYLNIYIKEKNKVCVCKLDKVVTEGRMVAYEYETFGHVVTTNNKSL